ncbi:MAG: hypothetical protein OSJ73_10410 [Lachnospiraceae bacterium]|nr:hypothetical protein [Lachnospiraceae bacterium]
MADKEYKQIMVLAGGDLGECPDKIKILPVGRINSEKGDFVVDEESYNAMKAEMQRRGIDIVIDYEHQTLQDVQAPASGWVKELIYTPEAIIAKVEWTQKAQEYLKNKEYRYLSPVVLTRKKDNKAVALHSLALTNTPAINGMFAIVNSANIETENDTGGKGMDLQKLKELLGLPADAAEETIMNALMEKLGGAEKKEESETKEEPEPGKEQEKETEVVANSVILGLLGLKENAKTEDVAGKIMALKAGADSQQQEITDALNRLKNREADEVVMNALKAGKITAAQKDWAKDYVLKDRKGFDAFIEKAPVVVPVGKLNLKDALRKNVEVDSLVLKATGMTKEDIEKYADKEDEEE